MAMAIALLLPDDVKPIEHIARHYQSFPGSQYVLPSDSPERERLALQHAVLKKAFENRSILPPVIFAPGANILDSGTGSGIFVLDAISQVPPTVTLYGLDIESHLFPVDEEQVVARGNIKFEIGSITNLPLEWSNTFTLVHQRLLVAALQLPEWKKAIGEMYRVIAPGGWVQIGEVGPWKAGSVTVEHTALLLALFKAKGLILDCVKYIPEIMREAGFVDVYEEERSIPLGSWAGQDGADARDNFMGVFRGMKTPVLKVGGLGFVRTEEEFDTLMSAVAQEWDDTPGAEIKFSIMCGRKPSETIS